jgi:ABC-type transporter Mla subunit MlaD
MKNNLKPPRTNRDAVAALLWGEIDTLLDKTEKLTGTINAASENLQVTINQLEGAGEKYNQAVLAANLHHKNEMVAYLRTVSTTSIAKTTEEQREIVQKLIREAVSKEITVLKKALSESSANHQVPFLSSWGRIIICCSFTALIGSAITVELIQRQGIS